MSENVQFDEDSIGMPRNSAGHSTGGSFSSANAAKSSSGMTAWLVSHGIMTSESSAKFVMGGFVAVNFILSGLVLYFFVLR